VSELLKTKPRSGGPRTTEGKSVTSRNSLKTGAYSGCTVLPGESESDFELLAQQFSEDFVAHGLAERSMTRDLAVLAWKRMRLERLENAYLQSILGALPTVNEIQEAGLTIPERSIRYLRDQDIFERHSMLFLKSSIAQLSHWIQQGFSLEDNEVLEDEHPKLNEWVMAEFNDQFCIESWEDWIEEIKLKDGLPETRVIQIFRTIRSEMEAILWVHDHQEDLKAIEPKVRELRILKFMQLDTNRRAHDDLARAFYRTLNELRKQQEWRFKHQPIDVSPTKIQPLEEPSK
jgi:hypothetical protein